MPNWPLGLWPLAAKLWLLTVPRYHYTLVNVWHLAIRSWSWYRTPSHVTHWCPLTRARVGAEEMKAEGGAVESWPVTCEGAREQPAGGWETHCHVSALTMPHYDWECHDRAGTMPLPGSAAHKHSHLWHRAKQFISQNFHWINAERRWLCIESFRDRKT